MRDLEWQTRAACREADLEAFYSEADADIRAALDLCRGCEVRVSCLEEAMTMQEIFGVWGGTTERERRRLFRAQRRRKSRQDSTAA